LPSSPQVLAAAAVQSDPCALPALTGAHLPSGCPVFTCRQELHLELQAPSQQTPSMQEVLLHSSAFVQVLPLAFFATHTLVAQ
jgi:hypothetical protein